MKLEKKSEFPASFGVFSPTGHVVMAFATDDEDERALQLLDAVAQPDFCPIESIT